MKLRLGSWKTILKINFTEVYDDTVELGKVVSASHKEGDAIEEGALVEITISKGPLKNGKIYDIC